MLNRTTSLLYISSTVRARFSKFHMHIQAGLPYIVAGYDVTIYFRSEATAKKNLSKMPPQVEFLENGLSRDHQISTVVGDLWSQEPAGYDVTRYFQLAVKCNKILDKSDA